jgi:hypothetical protein
MNTTAQKNELIFGYSSGNLGEQNPFYINVSIPKQRRCKESLHF